MNQDEFVDALVKMHNLPAKEHKKMGKLGRKHVTANYNFKNFGKQWVDLMLKIYKENGSWSKRKNYNPWTLKEVA